MQKKSDYSQPGHGRSIIRQLGAHHRAAEPSRFRSTKTPRDVVLGRFLRRLDEDLVGDAELKHFAKIHVGGVVGNSRSLLHIVGHDQYRHLFLQLGDELFDAGRGDRVKC